MKRTMTLVLNNGASINLSTMLQTSKPLKLTQVSVCSLAVGDWQCLSALQHISCLSLQEPKCALACPSCGLCCVLPIMSGGVQPCLSVHVNPLSLPRKPLLGELFLKSLLFTLAGHHIASPVDRWRQEIVCQGGAGCKVHAALCGLGTGRGCAPAQGVAGGFSATGPGTRSHWLNVKALIEHWGREAKRGLTRL